MPLISFDNLISRFGEACAWHFLAEIEKASGLSPNQFPSFDPETRLARALHLQDAALLAA